MASTAELFKYLRKKLHQPNSKSAREEMLVTITSLLHSRFNPRQKNHYKKFSLRHGLSTGGTENPGNQGWHSYRLHPSGR